ncbi:MAG: hypothetical protein ACI9U2_001248 [Bradymonadia bacterium]|jgi:hypothetical protein
MRVSRCPIVLAAAGLFGLLATGCGDMDLSKRSELTQYRVLAVMADIPQPAPDDVVTLTVIDHVPADVDPTAESGERFYVWEICPFSLGSIVGYACLDPFESLGGADMMMGSLEDLPPELQARLPELIARLAELGVSLDQLPTAFTPRFVRTEGPEISIDMATVGGVGVEALVVICAAVSPDGVCRNQTREEVTLAQGWNVYVKLYSGLQGVRRVDTVKVITARDFDGRNTVNPTLDGLTFTAPSGGQPILEPKEVVRITANVSASAADDYPKIRIDSDGNIVRDADGTPQVDTTQEEILVSWYATAGEFKFERTAGELQDNEFTLPEEPGTIRLYAIIRDGRGGFGVFEQDLLVSPAP